MRGSVADLITVSESLTIFASAGRSTMVENEKFD